MCAQRTFEMQEVLTLCGGGIEIDIVKISDGLIVVENDRKSGHLGTCRFAHLSVKEFLEKHQDYSREQVHGTVAEICLLNQLQSDKATISENIDNYVSHYWAWHCNQAGFVRESGVVKALLTKFLIYCESNDGAFLR